jgi:cytochrome c
VTQETPKHIRKRIPLPLVITLVLFTVVTLFFLLEFVAATANPRPDGEPETLTADTFMDILTPLMANADATRGEVLVNETFECHVCHVQNGGQIAPLFTGIAERAVTERPPLTAEAYLYEAIMFPTAHVVEGFSAAMPANYPSRVTPEQTADMIAYLLTQ